MTHRQRILAALGRMPSGWVPLDLGSTFATSINIRAYQALRAWLGLPPDPQPPLLAMRAATVIPADDVIERLNVSARPLVLAGPEGGGDRRISDDTYQDEWGVIWHKPPGGHYLNTGGPFHQMEEPSAADVESHPWPDPQDPGRYRDLADRARWLREHTGHAVVLSLGVGPVHLCQFLRGFGQWLEDLLARTAFAEALLARVTEFWVQVTRRALHEAGAFIDVLVLYDDLGTQRAPLMSPSLYRRLIKPRHRDLTEAARAHGVKILWHSCGAVYDFIPDLIDIGVDALNPIQVSAARMDTARLKREFGRDLAFWGGVDTGRVLPHGTPDDVRAEVRLRLNHLARGGGCVLCPVHNIQADVPPENVVALYDAAREYQT